MVEVPERLRTTPPAPATLARCTWVSWLLPVGVPTVLVALHMQLYGRWIVDDAAITFAYARSLASGEGAVLQPDADQVEGYSNPAWLAVLVLGRWLGLFDRGTWFGVPDLVLFPKIVALLCCAGVFAGFYAVVRAVSRRPVVLTVVAGAVTAAVPSFAIWVSSGLENPLLALIAVTLAALLARAAIARRLLEVRVAVGCGLLAALAALTRPDGLIYAAAYPGRGAAPPAASPGPPRRQGGGGIDLGVRRPGRRLSRLAPGAVRGGRWDVRPSSSPTAGGSPPCSWLAAAGEWATTVAVPQIMRYGVEAPRSSCGDTLTPGTATLG